jgi:hypothetical protein
MRHFHRADWMKADPSCYWRENVRRGSPVATLREGHEWLARKLTPHAMRYRFA